MGINPGDEERAALRAEIARKAEEAYGQVLRWAWGLFGPYYEPRGRHYLVDKEVEDRCRKTGEPLVAAASVYGVKHKETGAKRYFVVLDGKPREVASVEEGFGTMLLESHPTMRIEVKGEMVAPHRYSLCWACYELYEPQSAEELAQRRERREQKREAKKDQEFQEQAPLWAAAGLTRHDFEGEP